MASFFFSCFILLNVETQGQHFKNKKSGEGIEIFENGKKPLFLGMQLPPSGRLI